MTDMTAEQLCDWLYRVGYIDAQKERDYDPRSGQAWAEVHKALTAPSVPYCFMRADQIEGIELNIKRGYGAVLEARTTKDDMFNVPLYTATPAPVEPTCKRCGNPTMHVGDVCYGCCQAPADNGGSND